MNRFTRDFYSAPQLRDLSRQSVFVFRHLNHSDPVYLGHAYIHKMNMHTDWYTNQ